MIEIISAVGFGVAILFLLVGLVGVIVPAVPGILLMWFTVVVYAFAEGFEAIDPITFTLLSIFSLIMVTADLWLPALGAKSTGASKRSVLGGLLGGLVGFAVFQLVGAIVGYALGTFLGEYHKLQDRDKAIKASIGSLAGLGIATLVQFGAGIVIIIVFVWQVLSFG